MASWLGKSGVAIVCDQLTAGGKAVLQKAIRRAGWQTEQFSVCRWDDIPANTRALVACGDRALDELTGWKGGKRASAYTRGYLLPSYSGLPVVPTFDPSKVAMGQMKLLGLVMNDLGVALQAAAGTCKICVDPKAVVNYRVGLQALKDLYAEAAANPELLVAFDLETATSWEEDEDESIEFSRDAEDENPEENVEDDSLAGMGTQSNSSRGKSRDALSIERAGIRTVQFSLHPGTGISCDWSDECRAWVRRIMSLPNPLAGHNCFYRDTKVWMSDGSWKGIHTIKAGEFVRTLDEDGLLVNRKVTDTSHTKDNRKWLEVKVDGGYKKGTGRWGNPGVICTEDHKWILTDGSKVEAKDLIPGDFIRVPRQGSMDVIEGSILGDAYLSASQDGRFRCGHVNQEWARAKATNLGVNLCVELCKSGYKPGTVMHTFSTQVPHYLRNLYYREDGTRKWIAPSLRGLAIWYGDDGNLSTKGYACLSIHKYPENVERIKGWFERTFGTVAISKDGGVLRLSAAASRNFFEKMAIYLHPSMEYKLPLKYRGRYCGWMSQIETQIGKVESITPAGKGNKWDKHKYCLTVEDTHKFFTRMGLTKNSWLFDEPILRNHGIEIKEGTHDTLWMWHHLQPDLPAHLQGVASLYEMPFPWKHLSGADLDFYGAADVDAVQRIMSGLPKALARLGLQDGYEQYVRRFRPVLAAMERRGIPVSKSKLEDLRTWLAQEITRMDSELQPMIPSEWKGRKYWKTWPADCKPLVENVKTELKTRAIAECESSGRKVTKKATTFVVKPSDFDSGLRENVTQTLGYGWEGDQLYKELDFNPRSSQQILSYIKAKGYLVPLRFKDKEETTSDKELERLEAKTKDPVLTLVRGIRAYSKMGNAYAGKLLEDGTIEGGWQPGPDGRLRATITFGPATGQLSARNPNIMTCFDGETEILTPQGWVRFDNLQEGVKVAQFDTTDRSIRFVEPEEYIIAPHDGLLRHITTQEQIDLMVTENHECLVRDRKKGTYKKVKPDKFPKDGIQESAGLYAGGIEDWPWWKVCLAIAFQADGHIRKDGHGIEYKFSRKRKIGRLEEALTEGGISHRRYEYANGSVSFWIPKRYVPDWLWTKKFLGEWLLDLKLDTLKLIANELFLWDGDSAKKSTYYSKHKQNCDWAQIVYALTNRRSQVKMVLGRLWAVGVSRHGYSMTSNRTIDLVPHKGDVYCVTVPTGNVVTRRNNRIAITGNSPKRRADLANKFRQCIAAEPGHKLVELDYTAFHARTLGLAAQDAAYMKIAAMDIHSFVAAYMVRPHVNDDMNKAIKQMDIEKADQLIELSSYMVELDNWIKLPDADLKHRLELTRSAYKNVRNFKAKPAILGIGFKMGKRRLYYENRDSYESEAEAGKLIDLLRALFPRVFKWQDDVCEEADRTGRLINSWGACRWFHDVTKWTMRDGRWLKSSGKDAEKVTAYLPSSNAHFMLRDKLLQADAQGWLERYGLINVIHDAVLFHCLDNLVDECVHNIQSLLQSPVMQMADPLVAPEGFVCGAEAMVGRDWSKMEEVK